MNIKEWLINEGYPEVMTMTLDTLEAIVRRYTMFGCPVPDKVDEAAKKWAIRNDGQTSSFVNELKRAFIAGANWKSTQSDAVGGKKDKTPADFIREVLGDRFDEFKQKSTYFVDIVNIIRNVIIQSKINNNE